MTEERKRKTKKNSIEDVGDASNSTYESFEELKEYVASRTSDKSEALELLTEIVLKGLVSKLFEDAKNARRRMTNIKNQEKGVSSETTDDAIELHCKNKCKNNEQVQQQEDDGGRLFVEVTFDQCFSVSGGPELLEELEELSNHYALLFNVRKAKLSFERRSSYDGMLQQVQQIFSLSTEVDGSGVESDKGKNVETGTEGSSDELKNLHDKSVSKAADMAAGFTNALAGLTVDEIVQRTAGGVESLHSEAVNRISEMCCFVVSQLLMLGKSIVSNTNKVQDEDADSDMLNIEWPEDSVEKAKIIRAKAQCMTGYVEAVSNSFITGISDVEQAYQAAMKSDSADSLERFADALVQEKADAFSEHLLADCTAAVGKIQDGLKYLSYLVICTSMPAA